MSFPSQNSSIPDNFLTKMMENDNGMVFNTNKNNISPSSINHHQFRLNFKSRNRRSASKLNKLALRQRIQKQKEKSIGSDESSSETEICIQLLPRVKSVDQINQVPRTNYFDTHSMNTAYPSESDELDSDFPGDNAMPYNQIVSDFKQYYLGVTDYVSFVLYFLEGITKLNQKNSILCSVCCPLIRDFSLKALNRVTQRSYSLDGWSDIQVKDLRNNLLRLLFSSLASSGNVSGALTAGHVKMVLLAVMPFISNIISSESSKKDFDVKDVIFMCDVASGVLSIVTCVVKSCATDHAQIIKIIRNFSNSEVVKIFCSIASSFENIHALDYYSSSILHMIKSLTLILKSIRAQFLQQTLNKHFKQEPQNLNNVPHHHCDMLGCGFSHSLTQNVPMCSVATMSHLFFKIYSSLKSDLMRRSVLKNIRECGICCCMNQNFILDEIFDQFEKHSIELQQSIISLLEKKIYPQLGIVSDSSVWCPYCKKRKFSYSQDLLTGFSVTHIESGTGTFPGEQGDLNSTWKSLMIYTDLLATTNPVVVNLIAKHIAYLMLHGADYIRNEVFKSIILPDILKLVFKLRSKMQLSETEQIRIDCFLSLLSVILCNSAEMEAFVRFGGLGVLYELLFVPSSRLPALEALKVLIIVEMQSYATENTGIAKLYASDTVYNSSSTAMMTFSDILCQYSKFFLQKLNKANQTIQDYLSPRTSEIFQKLNGECCSHINGFRFSQNNEDNTKNVFNEELLASLKFLCDLWKVCRDVILKVPSGSKYLCNHAMWDSYNLHISLLRNLNKFMENECKEYLDGVLCLMENLLTVFLHFKDSNQDVASSLPSKEIMLRNIRTYIEGYENISSGNLQQLLNCLLQCCLFYTELEDEPVVSMKKNVLLYINISKNWDNSGTSSDRSDPDTEFINSSYDGDSERSDSENPEPMYHKIFQNHQNIQHASVVKLVLDLLLHFKSKIDISHWTPVAVHVIQTIIRFCNSCKSNISLLSKQGFSFDLLKGFFDILNSSISEVRDLQKDVLELFHILAQNFLPAEDLKIFLELFKSQSPPTDLLVNTLKNLVESVISSPSQILQFPCTQVRLKMLRNENKHKLKQCLQLYDIYSRRKINESHFTSWSCTSAIFPLTQDSNISSLHSSFSFGLWLMLATNMDKDQCRHIKTKSAKNKLKVTTTAEGSTVFHVVSVGSDTLMFEMWINALQGDIIFRLNLYNNEDVTCLADETCKGVLTQGKWNHISVNYNENSEISSAGKKICFRKINLLVDGVKEYNIHLDYENHLPMKNSLYFLLLGHSIRQSKEEICEAFYIASFMLFKGDTLSKDISYYISSLGPNVDNISKFALNRQKMFFPPKPDVKNILTIGLERSLLNGLSVPSLEPLQKNLLLSYSALSPTKYALYPQSVGIIFPLLAPFASSANFSIMTQNDWPAQQEPDYCQLLLTGRLTPIKVTNIYTAMHRVGGIAVFMFLFARVIECSKSNEMQASAFQTLLHLITSDSESADYFLKIGGDKVLLGLLTSRKLEFSHHMLKVILDACLSSPVMKYLQWKNSWCIDYKSDAIIFRPFLWILLTKCIFSSKNCPEAVQVSFVNVVRLLLRQNHPYMTFNLQQMRLMNMLEILLYFLKYHYILSDVHMPVEVAVALPQVIKSLLSYPMDVQQLWLVCNFLLLLHQASDTYVCHAKSSFFFLLEQQGTWFRRKMMKNSLSSDDDQQLAFSSTESAHDSSTLQASGLRVPTIQRVKSMTDLSTGSESLLLKRASSLNMLPISNNSEKSSSWLSVHAEESSYSEDFGGVSYSNREKTTEGESETMKVKKDNTEVRNLVDLNNEHLSQVDPIEELYFLRKGKRGENDPESTEPSNQDVYSPDKIEVYVGFLNVVSDVISHCGSGMKQLVLDVVKPEIFIVLVYNRNPRICAAVLEVILNYLQKSSEERITDFINSQGFHMLANQLHQLPVDPLVMGVCFNFMFFGKHAVEDLLGESSCFTAMLSVASWIPLLSILPNTTKDVGACNSILSALNHQLVEIPKMIPELMNNGLAESLVLCLTRSIHSSNSSTDSVSSIEKNRILKSISHIFRLISSNLFSSRNADDFTSFTSLLQLLFELEMQCQKRCGPSEVCVTSLRDCQCVIFQAAIDFIDVYNYRKKKDNWNEAGNHSIWEILINMPDNLNPYSTFLSSNSSVSSDSRNPEFTMSHSFNTLQNVEKANKELPMSVAVDRFRFILSVASDFVVFQDAQCELTEKQKTFFRSLFHSLIKGLSTMMGKSVGGSRTKWSAVIWSVKDTLRIEVSRLLVAILAQDQDIERKCFVLETLADQRKCTDILTTVLFSVSKVESLPIFFYSLYSHRSFFSQKQRNDFHIVFSYLKQQLNGIDFSNFRDKEFVDKFIEDWRQLWIQDRQKWLRKQLKTERIASRKLVMLAEKVSVAAMDATKRVVGVQSVERKKLMEELKLRNSEEVQASETWQSLVEQFTHERAVWHIKESYPNSWELDPTEGPQRIRKRLRRCYLNVEPKFVMQEFRNRLDPNNVPVPFVCLFDHESGIPDSSLVLNKLHANEKIEYTCTCRVVMPLEEKKGELLIGDTFLHFIEESRKKQKLMSERWPFSYIKEILPRRFELQNNAFEMFLRNGQTFLIAFSSSKYLEEVWRRLQNHGLPCTTDVDVSSVTQLWLDHSITNFEYITHLNKFAGRSFNDLMQYPVFPFVLSDYNSIAIDLSDSSIFRNLAKPIAIQNKEREEYYIQSYNSLKDEQSPFHYGSHYSNSGIVLHFLVRLLPYTYGQIRYQDDNFDIPDRTFHSISTSWNLVTKNSPRELVPEFFFLPEFLLNTEGFDFGFRQSRTGDQGERVNDVQLPPWCQDDPRLFVLINRQALEANHVTNNLKHWIDLVFGFKQTGKAAVDAINVFHPATYFGMDISKVEDTITRKALEATIKTVGQMPKQLFSEPHPNVALTLNDRDEFNVSRMRVLETVGSLKWGDYVGSPSTGTPNLVWRYKQAVSVGRLLPVFTNDVFGLQQNVSLLLSHNKDKSANMFSATYIRSAALISWQHEDGIVRIKFCRDHPPVPLLKICNIDPVFLCASDPDCNELFVAHMSGIIMVYKVSVDSAKSTVVEERPPIQLNGHSGVVNSICICKAFSIAVTGSEDKTCIIWDLNKLCYVRSIKDFDSAITLLSVSNTLGDIASVSDHDQGSCMKVHTINGKLVGSIYLSHKITAICYSTAPEGISVNVIATGLSNGSIKLWSSWNLKLVREIQSEKFCRPITCVTFSVDNQHLYAANTEGTVAVWEKPSKLLMSMPRFLMFT